MDLETEIKNIADKINKLEERCHTEMCFWDGCGNTVTGAHTVSESKHLKIIKSRANTGIYSTDYSNWRFTSDALIFNNIL